MRKRIAILTDYFGSGNCGGLLQAYALQKTIAGLGYDCMQISFCDKTVISKKGRVVNFLSLSNVEKLDSLIRKIKGRLSQKYRNKVNTHKQYMLEQKKKARVFADSIPHTPHIYDSRSISECCREFDGFVCGSDIIWQRGQLYNPSFSTRFLAFVPPDKLKISYATSIGAMTVGRAYAKTVRPWLKRLDAISVREQSAQEILNREMGLSSAVVADPTLLFTSEEWVEFLSLRREQPEGIFCYLLGNNSQYPQIIRNIAEQLKCRVKLFDGSEFALADIIESKINYLTSPAFLEAILNSRYVVTDSFHCVIFSMLFHKQFVVLPRNNSQNKNSFNTRVSDFLASGNLQDRYVISSSSAVERLLKPLDYAVVEKWLETYRKHSYQWLVHALKKIEWREI